MQFQHQVLIISWANASVLTCGDYTLSNWVQPQNMTNIDEYILLDINLSLYYTVVCTFVSWFRSWDLYKLKSLLAGNMRRSCGCGLMVIIWAIKLVWLPPLFCLVRAGTLLLTWHQLWPALFRSQQMLMWNLSASNKQVWLQSLQVGGGVPGVGMQMIGAVSFCTTSFLKYVDFLLGTPWDAWSNHLITLITNMAYTILHNVIIDRTILCCINFTVTFYEQSTSFSPCGIFDSC